MKAANYLKKITKGKQTLIIGGSVYKFVCLRSKINHLQREFELSVLAQSNHLYQENSVRAKSIFPWIIRYPRVSTSETLHEKVDAMIHFCENRNQLIGDCINITAISILRNYCCSLEINWDNFSRNHLIKHEMLQFMIPQTFMHGDFAPVNVGFRNNNLALFDWEFAYADGTFLYDCWYLNHICILKKYSDSITHKTANLVDNILRDFSLDRLKFNYFCNLMNRAQDAFK
jgi:hypothetical protein